MGRWTALLLAVTAFACAPETMTSAPEAIGYVTPASTPSTPTPHAGKADAVDMSGSSSTTGKDSPAERAEEHALVDALEACANSSLQEEDFEAAYADRSCTEWAACDGVECDPAYQSRLQADPSCELDVEEACDCLQMAWECVQTYGSAGALWVVLPSDSCFAAYDCD